MAAPTVVPDGFVYKPGFLTAEDERALLDEIARVEFAEVRFHGYKANRTVAHFGVDYEYDSGAVAQTEPLPEWLRWLRDRSAALAGIDAERLVEALLTRYPPRATIGWHRDAPAFGGTVIGTSLGASCRMRFRRTVRAARTRPTPSSSSRAPRT